MARTSGNTSIDQEIVDAEYFSNSFAHCRVEYKDNNNQWQLLKDLIDVSASVTNENNEKTLYNLIPPDDSMSFTVVNDKGQYTIGNGGAFDGVLVENREIRLYTGYKTLEDVTNNVVDTLNGTYYHTTKNGSDQISYTSTSSSTAPDSDITSYDSETYDDSTYDCAGYYKSPIYDAFKYDIAPCILSTITLDVTEDTGSVYIQYRTYNLLDGWSSWSANQSCSNGSNILSISTSCLYFQVRVFIDAHNLTDTTYFENLEYNITGNVQSFLFGEYFTTQPKFRFDPNGRKTVSVECVNISTKILDKKITTKEYTAPTTTLVSTFITDILTQAGLTSSDYDIATTTSEVRSPTTYINTSVRDILEDVLNYLQIEDDYRMFVKQNKWYLSVIPQTTEVDGVVLERQHTISPIQRSVDYDEQLSYVTVFSDDENLTSGDLQSNGEANLGTKSGSTAGDYTIDFTDAAPNGAGLPVDAHCYALRPVVTLTGDFTFAENNDSYAREDTSFNFTISGTSGTFSVTVYGVAILSPTGFVGEYGGTGDNQQSARGRIYQTTNPLCKSNADCQALAKKIFDLNSSPKYRIRLTQMHRLLNEINDGMLVWGSNVYNNNIMVFSKRSISYNASDNTLVENSEFFDNSQSFSNFEYDVGGGAPSDNDYMYDGGLLWDLDFGVATTSDSNTYTELEPISFS